MQGRDDGVISEDAQIAGTYLHGVFDEAESREALLRWAGLPHVALIDYHQIREDAIDRLADEMESTLDIARLISLLR